MASSQFAKQKERSIQFNPFFSCYEILEKIVKLLINLIIHNWESQWRLWTLWIFCSKTFLIFLQDCRLLWRHDPGSSRDCVKNLSLHLFFAQNARDGAPASSCFLKSGISWRNLHRGKAAEHSRIQVALACHSYWTLNTEYWILFTGHWRIIIKTEY